MIFRGTGGAKTDNHDAGGKVALRRAIMVAHHSDGKARVLDCCQGEGVIWAKLRADIKVESYWGLDQKHRSGRLQIDSARVLEQPGWNQDVIDVDTYGEPWRHWFAILKNMGPAATVFLTIGRATIAGPTFMGKLGMEALGMRFDNPVPRALLGRILAMSTEYCLAKAADHGIRIVEALEAPPGPRARYLGLRLERKCE